jgi:uncharacterized membrane protein
MQIDRFPIVLQVMQTIDLVALVLRWFHILAGMTAVGGMIFIRCVVVPSRDAISTESFQSLHGAMRPRWFKIVTAAIGTLLITGFINFGIISYLYNLPKWYHPVWGVKFLIAMVIFFLSSVMAGRSALADRFRQNIRFWLNLNIFLAVVVVCLSGVLKIADKKPKNPAATTPTTAHLLNERR